MNVTANKEITCPGILLRFEYCYYFLIYQVLDFVTLVVMESDRGSC